MSQAIYQPQPRHTNAGQTTLTVRGILTPSQQVCIPNAGDMFYLGNVSGSQGIGIKPDFGVENIFQGGTGLAIKFDRGFKQIYLRNPSATISVFYELTIGFDGYIDNRILLSQSSFSSVPFSVYDPFNDTNVPSVLIPDRSGQIITDNNANQWFALSRQYVVMFSASSDQFGHLTNTAENKNLGLVQPLTSAQFPFAGNLGATFNGGASANLLSVITEVYSCVPKP